MDTIAENTAIVSLTDPAAEHIKSLLAQEKENAGKALRIFVEGGGCSGMQYGMYLMTGATTISPWNSTALPFWWIPSAPIISAAPWLISKMN